MRRLVEGSEPLEDPSQPHVDATGVVRIAGRVSVHPLAGAPPEADFGDGGSPQPQGRGHPDARFQPVEAEITGLEADLPRLGEEPEPQRVDDLPLVAYLVGDQIPGAKPVVVIAPQEILVVDVGPSQGGLTVKGDPVPRVRIADRQMTREPERADGRTQPEPDAPARLETIERIRSPSQRLVEPIRD